MIGRSECAPALPQTEIRRPISCCLSWQGGFSRRFIGIFLTDHPCQRSSLVNCLRKGEAYGLPWFLITCPSKTYFNLHAQHPSPQQNVWRSAQPPHAARHQLRVGTW